MQKEFVLDVISFAKQYLKPKHNKITFRYKDVVFVDVFEDEIENIIVQYEFEIATSKNFA